MIETVLIAVIIFTELLFYVIFIDVILSWLSVFWLNLRPKFIADIIDPIYSFVKKYIPTSFWPLDFTPIIIILILYFIKGLIIILNPWIQNSINKLIN